MDFNKLFSFKEGHYTGPRRRYAGTGKQMLIGTAIGGGIGALLGAVTSNDPKDTGSLVKVGAGLGGVTGALAGYLSAQEDKKYQRGHINYWNLSDVINVIYDLARRDSTYVNRSTTETTTVSSGVAVGTSGINTGVVVTGQDTKQSWTQLDDQKRNALISLNITMNDKIKNHEVNLASDGNNLIFLLHNPSNTNFRRVEQLCDDFCEHWTAVDYEAAKIKSDWLVSLPVPSKGAVQTLAMLIYDHYKIPINFITNPKVVRKPF